jgi:hypothetical protein
METLAELQDQLVRLRAARATGAARVEFVSGESRRVTEYKSDADMASAIADLEGRIAAFSGRRIAAVHFSYSKGI